ncbi:MAG TPA: ATP synthase F0 subunit B [Terriglobales bacterium]|nr:ATP synthase F0 subunit B [Terriglobales bacterium]
MKLFAKFRMKFVWLLLLLIVVGIAPRVQAAEQSNLTPGQERSKELQEAEEEGTAAFKHSSSVKMVAKLTGLSIENAYWLCVVGNFAIVAGVLVWALRKNLPTVFRNRTASIQQAMAEARAASEDANRRLADIESRLSRLDGEIAGMRNAAEKEAADEEERIKAATADEMKKVVESAEQEISAAAKNARRELKAYAANLVVSLAEKQIKVDAATDEALVQGFAKRLASDGNSSRDAR